MMTGTPETPIHRKPEAGFTLIELLVAVSLLSLLTLTLFGALRLGMTAWDRGTRLSDRIDESLFAQSFLRRVIGDAYPLMLSDEQRRARVDFEGTANSLSFLASAPVVLGAGRMRFTLSTEQVLGQLDVILSATPELAIQSDSSTLTRQTLLANVASVRFSYFGRARSNGAAEWHDTWTGEMVLPQLVRIQVQFPGAEARLWPELIIAPRITADVSCIYDLLTKSCRGR